MARMYKRKFSSNTQRPDRNQMHWLYSKYVLGCPVENVSARGRSFGELGWKGHGFLTLESQLKKQSDLNNERWAWLKDDGDDFLSKIRDAGLDNEYSLDHEFAYYAKGNKQKVEGLFYLIRNALAHGSFRYHSTKDGEYLALETKRGTNLRGRAVLKIETFRAWRSLLDNSDKYLK